MAPPSPLAIQGPTLLARGYPIVPIKPGTKHPGMRRWQSIVATEEALAGWLANGHARGGVGVLTKHFPAIDLDVRDPEIIAKLVQWCADHGIRGPMRVGEAPKLLIACRTNEPFSKVSSAKYVDFAGQEHKVEILGDGQQYVAYATHPDTGEPYQWVSESDLAETNPRDLPLLTHAQALELCSYAENIFPDDWERAGEGVTGDLSAEPIDALLYAKPAVDVSTIKLQSAIDRLDPDMLMADWVRVGMGLYHQFNGSSEGFAIWDMWSAQGSKYNEREMRHRWKSFKADLRTNPTTVATILEMAKRATPALDGFEAVEVKSKTKPKFKMVHASEVLAKLGPIDWLVNGFLERNTTGLLFGDPGAFKSFLALDMALCVAAGTSWHGREVEAGPVVYIAGEGHGGLARRFAAWQEDRGVSIADLPFYVSEQPARLYDAENAKMVTQAVDAIAREHGKPRMIVIDTLARNFGPADENSNADMGVFIHHVDTLLRLRYEATVMIVHHSGHSQKQRARGATALKGGMDFEYRVERADGALSTSLICTKMKDAKEPEQVWFEGREVVVGSLEDEDMTSLVFDRCAAPVAEEKTDLKGSEKTLYDIIENEAPITRETLRELIEKGRDFASWNAARNTLRRLINKDHVVENDGHLNTQDAFFVEISRAKPFRAPSAPTQNDPEGARNGFAHLEDEDL